MAPLANVYYRVGRLRGAGVVYTSAKLGKQAVASVLELRWFTHGMLTLCDAQTAAGLILSDNAHELYRV